MAKVSHFRYALRFFITICCWLITLPLLSQTLGGAAAYNFLLFPPSASLTAAGGLNVSHAFQNVSAAFSNPALLTQDMHGQAGMHFTLLPGGIKALHVSGAYHQPQHRATYSGGIFFVHYGTIPQTDAAGNQYGNFMAYDYVVQLAGAKKYLEKWQYGGAVKWIQSFYGPYQSAAIAADVGLLYTDSLLGLRAGLVAKNMGVQISRFAGRGEDLPLDLQLGITKKLLQAPLAFSLTAHNLHRYNITYNDTAFNRDNNVEPGNATFKKIFNHFVLAGHVYLGPHLEVTVGYNVLRRTELSAGNGGNGLAGLSTGLTARFQKMQLHLARATYQKGLGYNQLGLTLNLNSFGGAGRF